MIALWRTHSYFRHMVNHVARAAAEPPPPPGAGNN